MSNKKGADVKKRNTDLDESLELSDEDDKILKDDQLDNIEDWLITEEESLDEKDILSTVPDDWRQASKVEDLLDRLQLHKEKQSGIKKQKNQANQDVCDDPLDLIK